MCICSTTVFSHSQSVVVCSSCSAVLCTPTGGKARLTEGMPLLDSHLPALPLIQKGVKPVHQLDPCCAVGAQNCERVTMLPMLSPTLQNMMSASHWPYASLFFCLKMKGPMLTASKDPRQ